MTEYTQDYLLTLSPDDYRKAVHDVFNENQKLKVELRKVKQSCKILTHLIVQTGMEQVKKDMIAEKEGKNDQNV